MHKGTRGVKKGKSKKATRGATLQETIKPSYTKHLMDKAFKTTDIDTARKISIDLLHSHLDEAASRIIGNIAPKAPSLKAPSLKRTEIDYTVYCDKTDQCYVIINEIRNAADMYMIQELIGRHGYREYRYNKEFPCYKWMSGLNCVLIFNNGKRAFEIHNGDRMSTEDFGQAVKLMKMAGNRMSKLIADLKNNIRSEKKTIKI